MMRQLFQKLAPVLTIGLMLGFQPGFESAAARELVSDPSFSSADPANAWWATDGILLERQDGQICVRIDQATENPWDAIIGLNDINLKAGADYRFSVSVNEGDGSPVRVIVQLGQEPWTPIAELVETATQNASDYQLQFRADRDISGAQIVVQFGGGATRSFCLLKVSLVNLTEIDNSTSNANIAVRANQVGYIAGGRKYANLVHPSDAPKSWALRAADGGMLMQGQSQVYGFDQSSGFKTHLIDFSDHVSAGEGLYLEVDGAKSAPFSVSLNPFEALRTDALSYFYLVRSGADIDDAIAGSGFGRPLGHGQDKSVGCLSARQSQAIYGEGWTCDYKLDVSGGWYDAGDYGKYVVNGGIAVAQIMSIYERALYYEGGNSKVLGKGVVRTDNQSVQLPDVLAEAKWELDFFLKMQVPEGQKQAGLVHHKIHSVKWTGLPLWPHKDDEARALHRPSTAASLNMAATVAQAARLFAPYDASYAQTLLIASKRAFEAALKTPNLYAPLTDGSHGGGDYDDDRVEDEFYWAAAELFITTGEQAYLDQLKSSPFWESDVFQVSEMTWQFVPGWARLQLATVPNKLPSDDRLFVQRSVIAAAENFLGQQEQEAFGLLFEAGDGLGWGSNNSIFQNMIVVSGAYDLIKDRRYLNAVRSSFDYVLGRNAIGQSYVTGHGSQYSQFQHSRLFAQHLDPAFPPMPNGALAGGANSWLSDDYAKSALPNDCAPQTCYVDDYRSYSTNEIAINWNAGLSWISSFIVDTSDD